MQYLAWLPRSVEVKPWLEDRHRLPVSWVEGTTLLKDTIQGPVARTLARNYLCRTPKLWLSRPWLGFPTLTRRLVLELRLVHQGFPVQAGGVEEVASTSFVSPPEALVDIGCAPSATPQRSEYTTVYE
jgi:hypothetical protein